MRDKEEFNRLIFLVKMKRWQHFYIRMFEEGSF